MPTEMTWVLELSDQDFEAAFIILSEVKVNRWMNRGQIFLNKNYKNQLNENIRTEKAVCEMKY